MQTIKFFTEILKLLVYIIVLFYYSIPIGLITCVRIPIYYVISHLFCNPLSERNEKNRASQSDLIGWVKKIFASLPAIKTLQVEKQVEQDLSAKIGNYCHGQSKVSIMNSRYQEVNTLINTSITILILFICGMQVLDNRMSIGTMMLISNVQSRTTMPLFFFNNYYIQYKSCFPGISRLVKFLSLETEFINKQEELSSFKTLSLENISYSYDDKCNAINQISLSIHAGEKIIITDDNMSGKSTLLKIMAGLIQVDSGAIKLDGKDITYMQLRNYATLFLQNQDSYLYFGHEGSGGEVQLENLSLMQGVKTPIILLDEADASINKSRFHEVYNFFNTDATVIIVTHRDVKDILEIYQNARVISMENL